MATQTGLIFVEIENQEMPEAVKMDPKLAKEWFPEIKLKALEERYFESQRVTQVIQLDRYTLLCALWEESGFWLLERQTQELTKIEDTSMDGLNLGCSDLYLLDDIGKGGLAK